MFAKQYHLVSIERHHTATNKFDFGGEGSVAVDGQWAATVAIVDVLL